MHIFQAPSGPLSPLVDLRKPPAQSSDRLSIPGLVRESRAKKFEKIFGRFGTAFERKPTVFLRHEGRLPEKYRHLDERKVGPVSTQRPQFRLIFGQIWLQSGPLFSSIIILFNSFQLFEAYAGLFSIFGRKKERILKT